MQKGPVEIGFNLTYIQHEARKELGISLHDYMRMPGTPLWMTEDDYWSKSHVIAWYQNHRLIDAVNNDAQVRKMKQGKHGKP